MVLSKQQRFKNHVGVFAPKAHACPPVKDPFLDKGREPLAQTPSLHNSFNASIIMSFEDCLRNLILRVMPFVKLIEDQIIYSGVLVRAPRVRC